MTPFTQGLEPETRARVLQFLEASRIAGIPLVPTSGLRTHAQQHALWLQGRGTPGPMVTMADQYHSWHETGRAVDVVGLLTPSGKHTYDIPWEEVAAIAANFGLEWGGSFKHLSDRDHFQYAPAGLTLAAALAEQDARVAA